MALTQTEARVMERWDGGQPIPQIARETSLTPARVKEIVQIYHCRPETSKHRRAMATASATLRTAILAQSTARQQGAAL
jgi:hypothetical protein